MNVNVQVEVQREGLREDVVCFLPFNYPKTCTNEVKLLPFYCPHFSGLTSNERDHFKPFKYLNFFFSSYVCKERDSNEVALFYLKTIIMVDSHSSFKILLRVVLSFLGNLKRELVTFL